MAWNENLQPAKSLIPCVAICVPHSGTVSMEWVESTWGPLRYIPQPDFAKTHRLSKGVPLDVTRNELVKASLEDKSVTHILFLDSDVIAESPPDINQALRTLLSLNVPVVSGLYRAKKQHGEYPYAMWVKNPHGIGYLNMDSWTGNWLKVSVIGFGFVLIKREVFETVPPPWFLWEDVGPSEDFYACELFAKYGFETKVFTDVKLSHLGTLKVRIDGSIHSQDV